MTDPADTLYVWVAEDASGDEGVVAFPADNGMPMPMMAKSLQLALALTDEAHKAARARQKPVRLVAFRRVETIAIATPAPPR